EAHTRARRVAVPRHPRGRGLRQQGGAFRARDALYPVLDRGLGPPDLGHHGGRLQARPDEQGGRGM
ncbi:MAG: hypothetical protein AVDCRST_MAG05-3663, partial [uncultured Rubrobacteraceae bacterium]